MVGCNLADVVSIKDKKIWSDKGKYNVVVIDCGVKYNILRNLALNECKVTVVPSSTSYEEIVALKPDGIMLSNGPGDPEPVLNVISSAACIAFSAFSTRMCSGTLTPYFFRISLA